LRDFWKIGRKLKKGKIGMIKICNRVLIGFCIMLFFLILQNSLAFSQEETEPIIVDGDRVEYFQTEKKVVGEGNVVATYKDMKLSCDKVVIYTDKKIIHAEGNVILRHEQGVFKGEKVEFDLNSKKGTVLYPSMEGVGPWYAKGETGEKFSEKSYLIRGGYITTCDLEDPHYRFQAKRIKVYLGEKIVAKNIVFKVKGVPLIYLPYYVHSLVDNRPGGIIIPCHSSEWGYYLLTSWKYVLPSLDIGDEHLDWSGRVYLDYRELKGYAQGFDTHYQFSDYLGEGKLKVYYTHEHDKVPPNSELSDTWKERYRVQLKHKKDFDNNSFRLEYHEMKDEDFIKDYFYEEYKRDHQPDSYVSLIHSSRKYNLSFLAKKRMNRFFTVVEQLPEIEYSLRKTEIKDTPLFFDNTTSFSNLTKKFADSSLDYDVVRVDSYNEISYPFKVLKFLNLEPWVGGRQTFYTKDSSGEEDKIRGIFYTGIDLSSKFYKIFDVESNFLNLDINKIRHIITPTIEYKYIHQPTIVASQLMGFDSIDKISRENIVTLGLENRLQTKKKGGDDEYKKVDLGCLRTTINYNFKPEYGSGWENLKADLELTPYNWLRMESDCKYNPQTGHFETVNLDTIINRSNYEFGVGHRYQQDTSSLVTTQFKYYINKDEKWTKRWIIGAYVRFEAETKEWEEYQVKLTKDLHCWLADFLYNYKDGLDTESGDNHTFYVVFRLKAFPEVPIQLFEASYERPKPAS